MLLRSCFRLINTSELHQAYIDLYVQLMRYIWDYSSVQVLARLEVATYRRFPDVDEIRRYLNLLRMSARTVTRDDEDVMKEFDNFNQILESIESSSEMYAKLVEVEEVIR